MAINPLYIPLFNIEEVILDKDSGLPLAAGVVSFYRDSQRLTPKVVYQIAGVSPNYSFISVGSQLTLGLSGTFVDQNGDPFVPYAYPYDSNGDLDLYYVTVVSSGGVPQFVRQAVPYVDTGGIPPSERTSTENEISNPQFVEVNFNELAVATISVTGSNTVTPIAPDWDLITSGTGTVTLERLQPISAGVVTNPPYALRIDASSGLGSTVQLRQRFLNTPSIFRNGFLSGSFAAAVLSGGGSFISMSYVPSTGTPTQVIPSTSIPTDGAYHIIAANAAIPDQSNSPADTGYVDIILTLPTTRNIAITSIQVVGAAIAIDIPFDEQTAERQRDHLAHYYNPQLVYKQVPSFLVGWDFPLNPVQFGSSMTPQATGANKSYYIWDQTILFQSATSGFNINRSNNLGGLLIAEAAPSQAAIIQYLDAEQAAKILSQELSVNLLANSVNSAIKVTVSLWYTKDASLPNIAANNSLIATLDANGKPATFNGNWVEVPREILQDAFATITVNADSSFIDYPFSGWNLNNLTEARLATFFAIVIGTSAMAASDALDFQSISLIPGNLPCRPAPQSFDEVFRQCQYFYEKSYLSSTKVGTVTNEGARTVSLSTSADSAGSVYNMYAQTFGLAFSQTKRVIPNVQFWTPAGLVNNIFVGMISGATYLTPDANTKTNPSTDAISGYTAGYQSPDSFIFTPTALRLLFTFAAASFTSTTFTLQSIIIFHYLADARLGII